jgi:hypothetical protein
MIVCDSAFAGCEDELRALLGLRLGSGGNLPGRF